MSLKTYIGELGNLFDENEKLSKRVDFYSPILTEPEYKWLISRYIDQSAYPFYEIK